MPIIKPSAPEKQCTKCKVEKNLSLNFIVIVLTKMIFKIVAKIVTLKEKQIGSEIIEIKLDIMIERDMQMMLTSNTQKIIELD